MICEVGSDFWEYNITPGKESSISINGIGKYKEQKLFVSGRNAIQALCKRLSSSSKTVLLPAFTCNTVIQPFVKAEWRIEYYNIKCDLTIDEENLMGLAEKINPCLILVHGYFGFNTLEKSSSILKELREKGIIIVEDTTQAFFSSFKKTIADYYVSSLRKWFAVSDGGLLVSVNDYMNIDYEGDKSEIVGIARDAFNTKAQYIKYQQPDLKNEFIKKYSNLKQIIDECNIICPMTKEAQQAFSNADLENMIYKRRENYNLLLNGLKDNTLLDCIFRDLPEDVVPLYFPVYIGYKEHRRAFQQFLADSNIYCPIVWPKPEEYTKDNEIALYIYEHILCIPCDQRYDEDDIKWVIACINEFRCEVLLPEDR
jgi:dTDP-4-amino-4,6-dideoxygalactose transaminase